MLIQFDHNPGWQYPTASHSGEGRTYMVAPEPYRLLVVVHDDAVEEPLRLGEFGDTFDCSVGWHDDHKAKKGFTLPQFRRKKHSKITVRRQVDTEPDQTLTGLLVSVPKGNDTAPGAGRPTKEPTERLDLRLPVWLIEHYRESAQVEGVTKSALMRAALEWCARGDDLMDSADYVAALVEKIKGGDIAE